MFWRRLLWWRPLWWWDPPWWGWWPENWGGGIMGMEPGYIMWGGMGRRKPRELKNGGMLGGGYMPGIIARWRCTKKGEKKEMQ